MRGWGEEQREAVRERGKESFLAADLVNNSRKEGVILGKCPNRAVCDPFMSPLSHQLWQFCLRSKPAFPGNWDSLNLG